MDNESANLNDTFQMQQMIIFLKAELAKYKNEVTKHQESDYYSLVEKLEEENSQLLSKNKECTLEILKLKKELEQKIKNHNEIMYVHETQRLKQVASIDSLLEEKKALKTMNKQITDQLQAVQDELATKQGCTNVVREVDLTAIIEHFDQKLIQFTEQVGKQLTDVLRDVEKAQKESSELIQMKTNLMKESDEKSEEIKLLQNEINQLKQQNENLPRSESSPLNGKYVKNTHLLAYLDAQMKTMLEQSIEFEEQVDAKLRILNDLEHKLNQLTDEMEGR